MQSLNLSTEIIKKPFLFHLQAGSILRVAVVGLRPLQTDLSLGQDLLQLVFLPKLKYHSPAGQPVDDFWI